MNNISNELSYSQLFAVCIDAKKCNKTCGAKHLTKVAHKRGKFLCLYDLVEKEPVFYRKDNERSKS